MWNPWLSDPIVRQGIKERESGSSRMRGRNEAGIAREAELVNNVGEGKIR